MDLNLLNNAYTQLIRLNKELIKEMNKDNKNNKSLSSCKKLTNELILSVDNVIDIYMKESRDD